MDTNTEAYDAQNNYEVFRFCYENTHADWALLARRNVDFFFSRQWDDKDVAMNTAGGRPSLTINIIESLVRSMMGVQRALRNDVRFAPVADADNDSAQVQDNLWLHEQARTGLDFLESEVWLAGVLTGRGYYDMRTEYDSKLRGNVTIERRRSQDVVLDVVETYDPEKWHQVFTSTWHSKGEIAHMFGKEKAEQLSYSEMPGWYNFEDMIMAQRMGRLPYYTYVGQPDRNLLRAYRLIERQYVEWKSRDVFVNLKTGDINPIPKSWDRERIGHILDVTPNLGTMKREVKQYKWMVSCENTILFKDDMPYEHFTIVPFFFTFYDGETFSAVDTLIDPQRLYNKMTSKELEIISTTSNSGFITKVNNIKNMTSEQLEKRGSKNGLVIEVANVADTKKIEPSQLPAGHESLSKKADNIMRSMSGVSNQSRGFAREDVAGEAILSNQAGMQLNFAAPLTNLFRSRQILARNYMRCVQETYTEERMIMVNRGTTFKPEYEQLVINGTTPEGKVYNDVTQGEYTTVLVPSPSRVSMTDDEFDQLVKLKEDLGIEIPDDILIELSSVPNKQQIIQRMKVSSNEKAAAERQREQEAHEQEQQLAAARAKKESTAADLNEARAKKFDAEAGRDPDEAYREVEFARLRQQGTEHEDNLRLEWAQEHREEREGKRKDAIDMAKNEAAAKRPRTGLSKRTA